MTKLPWFCMCGSERLGPMSARALSELAAAGRVRPDSLIARREQGPWFRADQVRGLFESTKGPAVSAQPAAAPPRPRTLAGPPERPAAAPARPRGAAPIATPIAAPIQAAPPRSRPATTETRPPGPLPPIAQDAPSYGNGRSRRDRRPASMMWVAWAAGAASILLLATAAYYASFPGAPDQVASTPKQPTTGVSTKLRPATPDDGDPKRDASPPPPPAQGAEPPASSEPEAAPPAADNIAAENAEPSGVESGPVPENEDWIARVPTWASAIDLSSIRVSSVEIRVMRAWRQLLDGKRAVAVRLAVANLSPDTPLHMTGWASGAPHDAALADAEGVNARPQVAPALEDVPPGRSVEFTLYFLAPAKAPWRLALPMQACGVRSAPVGFVVEGEMIDGAAPAEGAGEIRRGPADRAGDNGGQPATIDGLLQGIRRSRDRRDPPAMEGGETDDDSPPPAKDADKELDDAFKID